MLDVMRARSVRVMVTQDSIWPRTDSYVIPYSLSLFLGTARAGGQGRRYSLL